MGDAVTSWWFTEKFLPTTALLSQPTLFVGLKGGLSYGDHDRAIGEDPTIDCAGVRTWQTVAELGDEDVWLSYDREADVLYVSFGHRQEATDTVELDDIGVLLRYRGRKLVGITVLDASKR
jgi:uncharacterized protein YuzE